jgi:hypothetical protein
MADSTGVVWPAGQALPRFAAPAALEVLDLRSASAAEVLLATTAQGVINRARPTVWLVRDADEGSHTWLDTIALEYAELDGVAALVSRHRHEIRGAILADPDVPATRNVATSLAGLEDAVVAEPDTAERLHLPILADLRGRFAHDEAAYQWAVDQVWPRTTHRMLVGLSPDNPGCLRDYAVANRALVVWLDPGLRGDRALLTRLLAQMPPNSPYVGWWSSDVTGENEGTELTSRYGVYVVAADYSMNLTVLGGIRAELRPTPPIAESTVEGRISVTFTMTDGDNLQYCQHAMRRLWDTPERGKVPLNWTVSPLLIDAAPAILAYYQRTATANDLLVVGPSGAGYAYPKAWPRANFDAFTRQTGEYARHLGEPVVNVLNRVSGRDRDLSPAEVAAYARDVQPVGILQHWTSRHAVGMVAGVPVATGLLVSDPAGCRRALAKAVARRTRFVSIGVLVWSMTPADVAAVVGDLDDRFQVVRADHFFQRVRRAVASRPVTVGRWRWPWRRRA